MTTKSSEQTSHPSVRLDPPRRSSVASREGSQQPCPTCGETVPTADDRRTRCPECGTIFQTTGVLVRYWQPRAGDPMKDHFWPASDGRDSLPSADAALELALRSSSPLRRLLTPRQQITDALLTAMQALEVITTADGRTPRRPTSIGQSQAQRAFATMLDISTDEILGTRRRLRSAAATLREDSGHVHSEQREPAIRQPDTPATSPRQTRGNVRHTGRWQHAAITARCPACGAPTAVCRQGHMTRCPQCGTGMRAA